MVGARGLHPQRQHQRRSRCRGELRVSALLLGLWSSDWSYNEFGLGAGIVWNLWFTDQLAVYPKLGLDFRFGNWSSDTGDAEPASYTTVYLVGAAGVVYMINNISLRAELGIQALQLGVGVSL